MAFEITYLLNKCQNNSLNIQPTVSEFKSKWAVTQK